MNDYCSEDQFSNYNETFSNDFEEIDYDGNNKISHSELSHYLISIGLQERLSDSQF